LRLTKVHLRTAITAAVSLLLCVATLAQAAPHSASTSGGKVDTQSRLKEVAKQRKELQERITQARKKEQIALLQLHKIQKRLNVTTGALVDSSHKLKKTENKIVQCEAVIQRTESTEIQLTQQAAKRLREIYEGQRLSLLEMLFEVGSLQSLLDLFYYQERVAVMDRKLLQELQAQSAALESRKNRLGEQKKSLGDMVSEFAKKALMIQKEKLNQEQIADRLRNQREFYEKAEQQLARESEQLEHQIVDMTSASEHNKDVVKGSGSMSMPLQGQITSPFGVRRHPIFGIRKMHTGVDLAAPNRTPVKAADSGNVLYAGYYGGYGKVVIISHGNSKSTLYAHLSKTAVAVGQNVAKGEVVGYEGSTGFSTGPHLHFEVRVNGKPNNPLNFIR
jgi:murein DD-endopeptidase MepM/ murein hydrolase activator NlpD